jgi:hypothetical protein
VKDLAEQVNLKAGAAKGPVSLALVSLRGYARIPLSSGCSESAFSFRAGGPSRSHASLGLFSHRWFVLCGRLKLVAGRFHPPGTDSTWTTRVSNNSPRLG